MSGMAKATKRLPRDVAAYRRVHPTADERGIANVAYFGGLRDATDWEALYADVSD